MSDWDDGFDFTNTLERLGERTEARGFAPTKSVAESLCYCDEDLDADPDGSGSHQFIVDITMAIGNDGEATYFDQCAGVDVTLALEKGEVIATYKENGCLLQLPLHGFGYFPLRRAAAGIGAYQPARNQKTHGLPRV